MSLGGIGFADSPNYLIMSVSPSSATTIDENESFDAQIVIKNITGEELEDVYLTISSSNFKAVNGINTIKINSENVSADDLVVADLELEYLGGSGEFDFSINATNALDGESIGTESLSVSYNVDNGTDTPVVKDPGDSEPILAVDNSDIHLYQSGQAVQIEIPIKNESGHTAKNITMSFTDSIEQLPFNVKKTSLDYSLSKVSGKRTEMLIIDAVISPMADSKVHEMNVMIQYENLYGDTFTSSDRVYIEIEKGAIEPVVVYDQMVLKEQSVMAAGDQDMMSIVFYNGGDLEAKNIKVVLDGFSEEGILLNRDIETQYIDKIRSGSIGYVNYNIKTGSQAKSDRHELDGTITYTDLSGIFYEREFTVRVPVEGMDTDQVDLIFSDIKIPSNVELGETYKISGKITNQSMVDVEHLEISLVYSSEIVAKSRKELNYSDFKAGETVDFSYDLMVKPDSNQEYYGIDIIADYYALGDHEEDVNSAQDYVGFNVDSASNMGRPKLIIDTYNYGGESAMAGEVITLEMDVKNTSKTERVKNIKVTLSDQEGVFTPVNSSNSLFVDSIPAGGVSKQTMNFRVKSDAMVKNYQMQVKMEYEDSSGHAYDAESNPFIETEELSLNVVQPIRLEMGDLNLPFEMTVGQPFNVEMDFYNMGKSTMYNMMIKMDGNFSVQDGNYFVGNFETGRSDYYSGVLIPNEPGSVEGRILFTFEDALGNVVELEQLINVEAVEMDMNMNMNMEDGYMPEGAGAGMPSFEEEPSQGIPWFGYVIGVVVVIGGIIVWMRKRKKKKAALLAEDDDE
jgi:hypothetical protein